MEAMWTRFLPAICQVREWLADGEIGELRQIRADFGFNAAFNPEGRMFNKALAGGALLDAGIYPVSFASMIAGSPVAVEAIADIGSTGVDEQSFYLLRYEKWRHRQPICIGAAPVDVVAEIIGSEGKITVPRFLAASFCRATQIQERGDASEEFPYARRAGI